MASLKSTSALLKSIKSKAETPSLYTLRALFDEV
jgi:hypothetical protein